MLSVDVSTLGFVGHDLKRPECVLCAPNGTLYVAQRGDGILKITADGKQEIIGGDLKVDGHEFIPNGFALLPDGSFLIANMGHGGGLWSLSAAGVLTPSLAEVDGVPLTKANFVFNDEQGRIWVTVTTRSDPLSKAMTALGAPENNDGFICLIDERGARIVADGFAFTNEARIDRTGKMMYVAETFGRRITRFALSPAGELSQREVFTRFGHGTFADGIAFDMHDHIWVTSVISNRLIRVAPDGSQSIVWADSMPELIDAHERDLSEGRVTRDHFYRQTGRHIQNMASIAFGGADLRTIYLGSLAGDRLVTLRSPVAGLPLAHWKYAH
ncbi:MAG TPA: SMP-30/gluconolactonase/LRE family protein [Pseudolabrys sp.]|nr:SMP-30/gluconolactonase/LRE family protein [Pseudolabrys sp.]